MSPCAKLRAVRHILLRRSCWILRSRLFLVPIIRFPLQSSKPTNYYADFQGPAAKKRKTQIADFLFSLTSLKTELILKQECIPVGCVPPASVAILRRRVSAWGGCLPRGVSAWGGLPGSAWWGCLPRGVYTPPLHAG